MIYREGGCIDCQYETIWVKLEYDEQRNRAAVIIRDKKEGRQLAVNGCCGEMAKRFYDRLNVYFFGYE
ncbi:MAG: hypothetical protein RSA53_05365 [Odoribacter sp.]